MIDRLIGNVFSENTYRRIEKFFNSGKFSPEIELIDLFDEYTLGIYSFDTKRNHIPFNEYIKAFTVNQIHGAILLSHLKGIYIYSRLRNEIIDKKELERLDQELSLLEKTLSLVDIYSFYNKLFEVIPYPEDIREFDFFKQKSSIDKVFIYAKILGYKMAR